jgi:hypothetical protein
MFPRLFTLVSGFWLMAAALPADEVAVDRQDLPKSDDLRSSVRVETSVDPLASAAGTSRLELSAIPEPSAAVLGGLGLLLLLRRRGKPVR